MSKIENEKTTNEQEITEANEQAQTAIVTTQPFTMDDNANFIADLTTRQTTYCSLQPTDSKGKAILFKAMNSPEKRIGDCINMTIYATDLFCEIINCVNQQTGEIQPCPRIVIIDNTGVGYQAVSLGVFNAVKKLMQVYGEPTWNEPLPLLVKQVTKGERKILTFDIEV